MSRFRRSSEDGSGPLWGEDRKIEGCLENISVTVYSGAGFGAGKFEVYMYDGASSLATESQDPFFSANLHTTGTSSEGHDILQYIRSGYCHVAMTGSGAVFGSLR